MTDVMAGLVAELRDHAQRISRPVQIMEVCGTHTVAIFRNGIRSLLPDNITLVSGPGCPVCVTAQRHIDAAIRLARRDNVIVATYGDMVRVPGQLGSLERQRARGGDVRVVNSSLSAMRLAEKYPTKEIAFIGVGFETTAPATAAALIEADRRGLDNFTVVTVHKLVVPAMLALLEDGDVSLAGFLCPGHVSVIIGSDAYRPVVERHRIPCVVAGFEPLGILEGLNALLRQIEQGEGRLENTYEAAVTRKGNAIAQELIRQVFSVTDTPWRALGVITESGLKLRPSYRRFDALERFDLELGEDVDHPDCRCGEVIQGKTTPHQCSLFAGRCTPQDPLGPCMVSSEGTCSAWFKYGRPVAATVPGGAEPGA